MNLIGHLPGRKIVRAFSSPASAGAALRQLIAHLRARGHTVDALGTTFIVNGTGRLYLA